MCLQEETLHSFIRHIRPIRPIVLILDLTVRARPSPNRFLTEITANYTIVFHTIRHIADQNRNPVITDFLHKLKQDQKERLNRQ